jgi:Peptidase family M23
MHPRGKCMLAAIAATATLTLSACGGAALASVRQPAAQQPAALPSSGPATFTPVTVAPMGTAPAPFPGTDGRYHLVYEYELTNTKAAPATIERADVLDAGASGRVLASWSGKALLGQLRTLLPAPATSAVIEPDVSRLLFVELSFPSRSALPAAVTLHLQLRAAANPGTSTPTPMQYTAGRITISPAALPVISPPLAGKGWIVGNGCCNNLITHRGSFQSIDGGLYDGQRFAIDYMRLNAAGELVSGDTHKESSYVDYGASVLAVANATVVSTANNLPNQPPGTLPDPGSFNTVEEVDGNQVTLSLGHGLYAFYAHLIEGSVTVHRGERVHVGEVIGKLGNSGNTTAPHLHFQITNGPVPLGSEGVPYVIAGLGLAGQINIAKWEASDDVVGVWAPGWTRNKVTPQNGRFPLNVNIVDFPQT